MDLGIYLKKSPDDAVGLQLKPSRAPLYTVSVSLAERIKPEILAVFTVQLLR